MGIQGVAFVQQLSEKRSRAFGELLFFRHDQPQVEFCG
jgi:hypothetical protein